MVCFVVSVKICFNQCNECLWSHNQNENVIVQGLDMLVQSHIFLETFNSIMTPCSSIILYMNISWMNIYQMSCLQTMVIFTEWMSKWLLSTICPHMMCTVSPFAMWALGSCSLIKPAKSTFGLVVWVYDPFSNLDEEEIRHWDTMPYSCEEWSFTRVM